MMLSADTKIKTRDELLEIREDLRKKSLIVGYTSGVFDLLHPGHVDYLEQSKAKCDVLIVGLNTDKSVRGNKGPSRPICSESDRARVVAGLASVSYVFFFEEKNNNTNIELLKPDIYFKAGDYSVSKLTSAPIVESYGGKVEIIPMKGESSSSAIIDKVLESHIGTVHGTLEFPPPASRPAVFLDRDGTIIEHVPYLHEPEKVKVLPGALEGMKRLFDSGYRIIVITNQPGIGLGYFTKEDVYVVNRQVLKASGKAGVLIDKIYFCPHSQSDGCLCRKPSTGFIDRAREELNIDVEHSFVIGDMTSDIKLGKNAQVKTILVKTGEAGSDGRFDIEADYSAIDVSDAANWILSNHPLPASLPQKKANPAGPRNLSRDALEAIGQVGAKVGHDMNNFLGALRGCLDMVKRKIKVDYPETSPIDRQIALMEASVDRSTELTSKIRGFVRPGPLVTELRGIVEVVERVGQALHSRGVETVLHIEKDIQVNIHEYSIEQVLLSLGLNAMEAMQGVKDKDVVLFVEEVSLAPNLGKGRCCKISVMDHGKGLKPEMVDRVFTPFFSTKPATPGQAMGLSLAMAKEILRKHGGSISLVSKENCGTVVSVYLPVG